WSSQRNLQNTNEVLLNKLVGELDLNIERLIYLDSLAIHDGKLNGLKAFSLRSDTAIKFIGQGLDTTKVQWLLKSSLVQGSTLNLHASVYEEMKNTGRLYSLGSDSLLAKINRYYERLERETFYTDDANSRLFKRWTECKYGYILLRLEYSTDGISALKNHPWLYDQNSKDYQDLKIAIHESSRITKSNRFRMKAIIKESKLLKLELNAALN
ncbi:MAG: hypothetical protein ACPGWM_04840, partial [Flavobacteriales bacterium]